MSSGWNPFVGKNETEKAPENEFQVIYLDVGYKHNAKWRFKI